MKFPRPLLLIAFLVALLIATMVPAAAATAKNPDATLLTRIAFGSCNNQYFEQPLWTVIAQWKPNLFIWLGDNIYGDSKDVARLTEKWNLQINNPAYQKFVREIPHITGTWDDHDFGGNNAGKDFPVKVDSQRLLLEFLNEPASSPRWKREGIYGSRVFGPPGHQVNVILLDVRYFRDPPNSGGDILGEAQWAWLEKTLKASHAQVHLICSGSQIIPEEHLYEKWADYPGARHRLFKLIGKYRPPGTVLLTGDRHIGEISLLKKSAANKPLLEVTSSGLTHYWKKFPGEPNRHRAGESFVGLHYGTIEIDWEKSRMDLQLRDNNGNVVRQASVSFANKN